MVDNQNNFEGDLAPRIQRLFPDIGIDINEDTNPDFIISKAFNMYHVPGNPISEQKLFDLWQMLYDTPIDFDSLENF